MSVKLLTEHHLRFLNFKGGCTGSSESTFVKVLEITSHGSISNFKGQLSFDKLKINQKTIICCLIQDLEADFLWKVSLKILNSGIILKTFTHASID